MDRTSLAGIARGFRAAVLFASLQWLVPLAQAESAHVDIAQAHPAHVDNLPARLAATAPTPCLNAAMMLGNSVILQSSADAFANGLGKAAHLSAGWAPGNEYFDHTVTLTADAFRKDATLKTLLARISPRLDLEMQFRRATPEEQTYLRSFFGTPEGQAFWKYLIDGAYCSVRLEAVSRQTATLPADQRRIAAAWTSSLAVIKKASDAIFERFSAEQKQNLNRAVDLYKRLVKEHAPDEEQFLLSRFPRDTEEEELRRVAVSLAPQTHDLVVQFQASEAGKSPPTDCIPGTPCESRLQP